MTTADDSRGQKIFLKMFDRVFGLRPPPPMNPNPAVEMAAKRRRRRENKTEAVRQHALPFREFRFRAGSRRLLRGISGQASLRRLLLKTILKWPQRGTEGARRGFSTLLPSFPSVEIPVPSCDFGIRIGFGADSRRLQRGISGQASLRRLLLKTILKWPQRGTEGARRGFPTLLPSFPSVEIPVPSGKKALESGLEPAHAGCYED